jgi:tetratricopeptide (TPR) repeat protein
MLYAQRDDASAVMWSYRDFRTAYPAIDTHAASEVAGYQMLKMGQIPSAIALLERNAAEYPRAATSAFGLGRAYRTAGKIDKARAEFQRALTLDPAYKRAADALRELK